MIRLNSDIFGYKIFEILINWNLQIGGALFGIAFLAIAARLPSVKRQRNTLILTGIGMMLLFSSKDISSLVYSTYPPLGAVSIGFIGLLLFGVLRNLRDGKAFGIRQEVGCRFAKKNRE